MRIPHRQLSPIRLPLIVRWPGIVKANLRCDAVVHGCDLFPTFCAAAELTPQPSKRDGVSLLPVLKDPSSAIERSGPLIWHFPYYHPERRFDQSPRKIGVADFVTSQTRPHSAIRSGDWKLLQFYEDDRIELYDLAKDLSEQNDVAADRPEVRDRLREQLSDYLRRVHARLPIKVPPVK